MTSVDQITDAPQKMDGRRARSSWKSKAEEMKRSGKTIREIADFVGRSPGTVQNVIRGVRTSGRAFSGSKGFNDRGLFLVPSRFSQPQYDWILEEAREKNISISTLLRRLVDNAMSPSQESMGE